MYVGHSEIPNKMLTVSENKPCSSVTDTPEFPESQYPYLLVYVIIQIQSELLISLHVVLNNCGCGETDKANGSNQLPA